MKALSFAPDVAQFNHQLTKVLEERYAQQVMLSKIEKILKDHLDNAAGDSSWVMEALEILEGKR